jgi:hypothetical protein
VRDLFRAMDDALVPWANGNKDEMIKGEFGEVDGKSERDGLVKR